MLIAESKSEVNFFRSIGFRGKSMSFLKKGLIALVIYGAISSSALAANHVAGEYVYNVTNDAFATVLGVASDGTYVIEFVSGTLQGQTESGWADSDLAFTYGCQENFCVGEASYNLQNDALVKIIGLQNNGDFAVQFTSGNLLNQTGHGWATTDLAKLSGCSANLCVGENAYNTELQAQVKIIGIASDGTFVVRVTSGNLVGQTGHGWAASDLVYEPVGPTPNPIPQPQPGPRPLPPGPRPLPPGPRPHPPIPVPAPQPRPIPGLIDCVIRAVPSSNGEQIFNVVTPQGSIVGSFSTSEQAAAFAEQDPQCRS
jgi:hypothetical protein